jgi:hypothetical protein
MEALRSVSRVIFHFVDDFARLIQRHEALLQILPAVLIVVV